MDIMDKKDAIRNILKANIYELSDMELEDDQKLISTGLLESYDIINLISIFENTFGITIKLDEIDLDSFNTINKMEELVYRYE